MTNTRYQYGPTYAEMLQPDELPPAIRARSADDRDLFGINWKDATGAVRHFVLPPALTGVNANIVVLRGDGFPTGSHKVGAAYAVAMSEQLAGNIAPDQHQLVWPSTGNYGIGGAWVGRALGYHNVVVLPELMSRERFAKLKQCGAEIIKTPGSESNVKEIYDRCEQLGRQPQMRVLNQFSAMANYRFHYFVTGNSILELVADLAKRGTGTGRVSALVAAMGSGGTLAAGDRIKQAFGESLTVGLEPVQCPTLFNNGYGAHTIEGIGDKHVTWIHNVSNMDALMCIDDEQCKRGLQLLTSQAGQQHLLKGGVSLAKVETLARCLGLSGVCNVLGAIKTARYYGMSKGDTIVTVATDGIDRYHSVLAQMVQEQGPVSDQQAPYLFDSVFGCRALDWVQEGTMHHRQRWHNLKYFTWVEQRGKSPQELDAQKDPQWWLKEQAAVVDFDDQLKQVRGSL